MTLEGFAKSYAVVFGFMHLAALILGLRIAGQPLLVSVAAMILFAFLCFSALLKNPWLRLFLGFGWSVSVMVEWMHLIPWAPAFTDLQYVVIAALNMGMALSAVTLSEVFG